MKYSNENSYDRTRTEQFDVEKGRSWTIDKFSGKLRKRKILSPWVPWLFSIGIFLFLWLIFELFYQYHVDFANIFTSRFYSDALDSMLPCKSEFEIFLLFGMFVILFYYVITALYCLFDLLALPYWINKSTKKHKQFCGEAIYYLYRLPIQIPKWICIWCVGMLFGMVGLDNPLTKEGRDTYKENAWKELEKMQKSSANDTRATCNYDKSEGMYNSNRPINAVERFTLDYANAAKYSYDNGGPIKIEQTYGLSNDEITMAIANAEAYLDSMKYKKK